MTPKKIEVRILKKSDDPRGLIGVSVGGDINTGIYCVYRGTKEQAIEFLEHGINALKGIADILGEREPDIAPDDGKEFA